MIKTHFARLGFALAVFCISWFSAGSLRGQTCPYYLYFNDIDATLPSGKIKQLRAFRWQAGESGKTGSWHPAALQVDPIDKSGSYLFYKKPDLMGEDRLFGQDRIVFTDNAFGAAAGTRPAPPCSTRRVYEFESDSKPGTYTYLAVCKDGGGIEPPSARTSEHLSEEKRVRADQYIFQYNPQNHILFDKILH